MSRILAHLDGPGAPLTNTTTEGSLAGIVFPAFTLHPTQVIEFTASARVEKSNSTDTLTPRVRFGTDLEDPTANTDVATGAAVDAEDGDVFVVQGRIHCQKGRLVIEGVLSDCDAAGSKVLSQFCEVVDEPDLSVPHRLDVTGTWSVASADNIIQAESWDVIGHS